LCGVDFSNAYLRKTGLTKANLQGAWLSQADLQEAMLDDAKLQMANLWHVKLWKTTLSDTDFRGILGNAELAYSIVIVKSAIKNSSGLKTDLCGITLYDDNGTELVLTEAEKKEWLCKRGAKVENLSAVEAQELYKELKIIWGIEEGKDVS